MLLQQLKEEYDAVLICTGATWPRDLTIPGRQLSGIHFAVTFLEHWQKKQMGNETPLNEALMAKGKNVIIIGGGDTGCDCIATSLRQVSFDELQFFPILLILTRFLQCLIFIIGS